jgi:hypothetical protein
MAVKDRAIRHIIKRSSLLTSYLMKKLLFFVEQAIDKQEEVNHY